MPANPAFRLHPHAPSILVLIAGLLATWFAYAPGMGGSLHFDDPHNLQGLATVHDPASALQFLATGTAGPLGRPLALASFVPQAYAWPSETDVFLRTNILIHLLNGALLTWFFYLLGIAREKTEREAAIVAAGAAAIWMLMPLLASSSLLIVQRMTTLSASFMLLGAVGYLYARRAVDRRPFLALCGMTLAVGLGAALGALAKENGALLFLFILAIEATLLDRPSSVSRPMWRAWFIVVLIMPLAALLVFLASVVPYAENTVLIRDFTGLERVITQAGILWKYLYLAFLPNIPSLGPFHDDYPVQRSLLDLATLVSIGGWLVIISAAIVLRRRAPIFTFAVSWFLLGHLLESTTFGLELYYEHRNYMPLAGPVYALVASLARIEKQWRRIAAISAVAYTGMLGAVLFSTTSLWGSPVLAAEMWYLHKPHSLRALQYVAGGLAQQGKLFGSRKVLFQYLEENPEADGVRLQALVISCGLGPESDHGDVVRELQLKLASTHFNFSTVEAFRQLDRLVRQDRCPGIDNMAVYKLGQSLLDNPRFHSPVVRHNIHATLAMIGIDQRDFGRTMMHMEEALRAVYNTETLFFTVGILNSAGRYDISKQLLTDARDRDPPQHPIRALQWQQELERIDRGLLMLERQAQGPSS